MVHRSLKTRYHSDNCRFVASLASSGQVTFSLQVTGKGAEVQMGEDQYHSAESMPKSQMQLLEALRLFSTLASGFLREHFPSVSHVQSITEPGR